MSMESQNCPQQAIWVLSVVKAGQTSQPLTSFASSFSWRCSGQTGSLSQIPSGHLKCCLKEIRFQLIITQFNPVELLSSSWVAFYLWNNLLLLIHLSWNLTTTTHHEKNKTDWIHSKHALWEALAGWGVMGSNMLWLCATLTGQSYSNPSIKARLSASQTKFCLWEEKPASWNAEPTLCIEHSRPFLGSYEHLLYITNTPLTLRDSVLPFSLWS